MLSVKEAIACESVKKVFLSERPLTIIKNDVLSDMGDDLLKPIKCGQVFTYFLKDDDGNSKATTLRCYGEFGLYKDNLRDSTIWPFVSLPVNKCINISIDNSTRRFRRPISCVVCDTIVGFVTRVSISII